MSRLPRWRDKRVGFHCAAIFRQTVIQSVERRATLIQRNSDRCSGTSTKNTLAARSTSLNFLSDMGAETELVSAATSVFQLAAPEATSAPFSFS
jgi:hypothetical protein